MKASRLSALARRTRALPVGASSRMLPPSTDGSSQSTFSRVVFPVPAGPIRTAKRLAYSSSSAATFSVRASSSSGSAPSISPPSAASRRGRHADLFLVAAGRLAALDEPLDDLLGLA